MRCCTWEGRPRGSGEVAKHVLQETLVTLVHLLNDAHAKNEYVRTIAVSLMTWSPFLSSLPACCFAEESCEALLSRMGHRCEVNRHLHGYDSTFNLFLTLPNPSRLPKGTRGSLKQGMVGLFASRIRKIVFGDGDLLFCPPVATRRCTQRLQVFSRTTMSSLPPFPESEMLLPSNVCCAVHCGRLWGRPTFRLP